MKMTNTTRTTGRQVTKVDGTTWKNAPLVALDLEGTGAQDRDNEAILEIAVVPITGGRPSLANSYSTLVSPGRPAPRKPPWPQAVSRTVPSGTPPEPPCSLPHSSTTYPAPWHQVRVASRYGHGPELFVSYRQDDVAVLNTDVEVAQDIVGHAPR